MKNAHEVVITCNSLSAYRLRVIFCNDMIIVMLWIYDRQWKKALEKRVIVIHAYAALSKAFLTFCRYTSLFNW